MDTIDNIVILPSHTSRYPVEYTAGGCALNSSRVFCWVLGEPHRVVFVGGIGKDTQAQRLSTIVEESGVVSRSVEEETIIYST